MFNNSKQDWNAILSSEIAANFLNEQVKLDKIAAEKKFQTEYKIFEAFAKFQDVLDKNPEVKKILRHWKNKFATSEAEAIKNPKLAKALEMFDLGEE